MAAAGRAFGSSLLSGLRPCTTCASLRWSRALLPGLPLAVAPRRRLQRGRALPGLHGEKATRQWASKFVHQLTDRERRLLREAMRHYERHNGQFPIKLKQYKGNDNTEFPIKLNQHKGNDNTDGETERLTKAQLRHVLVYNALPFVGFGFLDNAVMITAGEYIDYSFGALLSISTMAAAALGNLVSDLFGVGLAGYVEMLAVRVGVSVPDITPAQHESNEARWASAAGRALGVSVGCIIGMFPLLFFHEDEEECTVEEHKAIQPSNGSPRS